MTFIHFHNDVPITFSITSPTNKKQKQNKVKQNKAKQSKTKQSKKQKQNNNNMVNSIKKSQ